MTAPKRKRSTYPTQSGARLTVDAKAITSDPAAISPECAKLAVPTSEHYLPLLYVAGASGPRDRLSFPYEGFEGRSMSMRMVMFQDEDRR